MPSPLFEPTRTAIEASQLTEFQRAARRTLGLALEDWAQLHDWSVSTLPPELDGRYGWRRLTRGRFDVVRVGASHLSPQRERVRGGPSGAPHKSGARVTGHDGPGRRNASPTRRSAVRTPSLSEHDSCLPCS